MRYWKRVDSTGKTTTVESYSHNLDIPGAVEISKDEFDAFIASLPQVDPMAAVKAEWKAAATVDDKLKVLAKVLGLV
jgi:hypothetical protein